MDLAVNFGFRRGQGLKFGGGVLCGNKGFVLEYWVGGCG